jgi:hypothetical protein
VGEVQTKHWFDLGSRDGRCGCGYAPIGPHDPQVVFFMSEASCDGCKDAVQRHIESIRAPASREPLDAVSGVC